MALTPSTAKNTRIVAVFHIIIGALSMLIGVVQLATVDHWSSHMAYGLWGGSWILVTGILGYMCARETTQNQNQGINSNTDCLIGTHMTFAIIAAVMCGIFVIVLGVAVGNYNNCIKCNDYSQYWWCGSFTYNHLKVSECRTGKGLTAFLLVLQILEFIFDIMSSAFCCSAICCRTQANTGVVFVPAQGTVVQGTVIGGQTVGQTTFIQQPAFATTTIGYPQGPPPQTVYIPGQGGAYAGPPPAYMQQPSNPVVMTTTTQYPQNTQGVQY